MKRVRMIVSGAALLATSLGAHGAEAQITFETGTIEGTVLRSDGAPVAGVSVLAMSLSGAGEVFGTTDETGTFVLGVPTGTYRVETRYEDRVVIGRTDVTVVAHEAVATSFTFVAGSLSWGVFSDGAPVSHARIQLVEQGPAGCEVADSCWWLESWPEGDACECDVGDRGFSCFPGEACRWNDHLQFTAWTDATGTVNRVVPPATYELTAWSGDDPESELQFGAIQVGDGVASITDLVTTSLSPVDYSTGVVTGAVTVSGEPVSGALLRATPLGGRGEIYGYTDELGGYAVTLPAGTYEVTLEPEEGGPVTSDPITLAAGETVAFDFATIAEIKGRVTGTVLRDGEPDTDTRVSLQEHGPASCDDADSCEWRQTYEEGEYCYCERAGRSFQCAGGTCYWEEARSYQTRTGADGVYDLAVSPGSYRVTLGTEITEECAPEDWECETEPGEMWGDFFLGNLEVTVVAETTSTLPTTSYQTGTVEGELTNCGVPTRSLVVTVENDAGRGIATERSSYRLRVPVGDYFAQAGWQSRVAAEANLTIAAGQVTPFAANTEHGQLRGIILRDGAQEAGAAAWIMEKGPASCDVADSCAWQDEWLCDCELDGRGFVCEVDSDCQWHDAARRWVGTSSDGVFTVELPAGDYRVQAYSGSDDEEQEGRILVGTFDARVAACQLVSIGTSATSVDEGTDVVADLGDLVTIEFGEITGAGGVSFTASSVPPTDEELAFQSIGLFYDITVEATFEGVAEVCLPYDADLVTDADALQILHYEGGQWQDITTRVDTALQIICGETSSFSPFVVGIARETGALADAGEAIDTVAGPDCTATVTLDASGSSGSIDAYDWYVDGNFVGDGEVRSVVLGRGRHAVELVVTSANGMVERDTTVATVVDASPPQLSVSLDPALIWPPNGKMRPVTPSFVVRDDCDAPDDIAVTLIDVVGTAADTTDVVIHDPATGAFSVRAYRDADERSGRVYTATFRATDSSGNAATATAETVVPHGARR